MDRNHVKADNKDNYCHYFEFLHARIQQYNVEPRHIYNMCGNGDIAIHGGGMKQKVVQLREL
jgi:hypothetical protein